MFLRLSLLPLLIGLSLPAHAGGQGNRSTSLIIHDENTRKYCNDGFYWDTIDKLCIADSGR